MAMISNLPQYLTKLTIKLKLTKLVKLQILTSVPYFYPTAGQEINRDTKEKHANGLHLVFNCPPPPPPTLWDLSSWMPPAMAAQVLTTGPPSVFKPCILKPISDI